MATTSDKKPTTKKPFHKSPFSEYFNLLSDIDKGQRYSEEYGSIMILGLMEEVGEMARAYLAEHGRKKTNLSAQADESYQEELGDLILTILRFARIKNINLHERIMYSLEKVQARKRNPKGA
ncbi:MAG: MazG nucleotide pyrophosphohydrolase domain-containing protein [Patescibacteria group bacterium]